MRYQVNESSETTAATLITILTVLLLSFSSSLASFCVSSFFFLLVCSSVFLLSSLMHILSQNLSVSFQSLSAKFLSPRLSYEFPSHDSRCSCVSVSFLSQNLQERSEKDPLQLYFTPFIALALYLNQSLLLCKGREFKQLLSSGLSVSLSDT